MPDTFRCWPRALCRAGLVLAAALGPTAALGPDVARAADGAAAALHFERVELSPHERMLGAASRDLDGDGRPELIVASAERLGSAALQRHLTLYRWPAAGAPELWRELVVPDDAVAYAVGDVLGRGRAQILYLAPTAVFALDPESGAVRKLLEHRLLATLASPNALPFWEGLRDLDGDGRLDLVLPDASGYAIYRSLPDGSFARTGRIEAGSSYASEPSDRAERRRRGEAGLVTARAVNQIGFADVNADSRVDLVTMDEDRVLGFAQGEGLRFPDRPSYRSLLIAPGAGSFADLADLPSPEIQMGDVDGDGRADFVVPELDVRELVTRLRVFFAGEAGPLEKPSQLLKLSSLGSEPELVDVNGDGHLDLGCTTVRTDRLRALANPGVVKLDFTYYAFLFRSEERAFSARPDVQWDVSVQVKEPTDPAERERDSRSRSGFMRMSGDFDGDGVRDLARLSASGEVAVFRASLAAGDRMRVSIASDALLGAQVKPTDRSGIRDLDGDGRSDIALFYEDSLLLLVTRG